MMRVYHELAGPPKPLPGTYTNLEQMIGPTLRIVSATWGTADATADVTQTVDQAIADNRELLVDNADMGSDPSPGHEKSLRIRYSIGSTTKDVVIHTGSKLTRESLK